MKTKTILTVISLAAFLFTSCQKDEMDHGTGAGGGILSDTNLRVGIIDTSFTQSWKMKNDSGTAQTDSILNRDDLQQ